MHEDEQEYSFKSLFIPFTTLKAIHYIILIGLLVFGNALINGFVWDDKTYILNNPGVHSINIVDAFKSSMFNQSGQYRPIPVIYFSTLYSLFNTLPFFYHFIQVIIHIVNAVLVFLLFSHFFRKQIAFFLSLIFLVHPIQVESVAYIGASGNNLFLLFGMSALLLSMKVKKESIKSYILLSCLLLLALFSKETGGLLIAMLLLFIFIYKKKKLVSYALLSFITLLIYFTTRFLVGGIYFEKLDLVAIGRLTFEERLLNIPSVIFYYIKTFFYPVDLAIGQEWIIKDITIHNFYFPLIIEFILLLFIIFFAGYLLKRKNQGFSVFLFFSLWLLFGLFLHSQIFPLDWTVADRWFYFPIIGLLGMIGVLLQGLKFKHTNRAALIVGYSIAIALVVTLSIRTIIRNTNWIDAITLYSHDTRIVNSWDIENNLGFEYKYLDNQPEALKHYLRSVELFPFESNLLNTGIVYGNMGNHRKAVEYYYNALGARHLPSNEHKHNHNTYFTLINGLLIINDHVAAKRIAEEALLDYPDSATLWSQLAITQYLLNDYDNAVISAKKAEHIESTHFTQYIYNKIINKEQIKVIPGKNEVKFL